MPPRHGKSELCSVRFPSWFLGKNPDKSVVLASYSQSIASDQSRKAKDCFYSSEYKSIFPNLTPSLNSKKFKTSDLEWETTQRGKYFSVGIGGALTGRGFDIGIIDDYYKDRVEADSEASRKRLLDWYRSTFYTRQMKNASIIIIATRWAIDDLIGTLIKEMEEEDGETWEIVTLPAISDNKALWPIQYPIEELERKKKAMGSFEWSALYQGEPTIRGGNRFNVDNVQKHDIREFPDIEYIRAWDLASTAKERNKDDPDFTVGVLGGVTQKDGLKHLWIKNIVVGQWEAPKRDRIIKMVTNNDTATVPVYIEAFAAYKDAYTTLKELLLGQRIIRKSRMSGDKSAKVAPMEPLFEIGNIHIVKDAPWVEMFLKHFREFPYGRHDDICDACSIVYNESLKARTSIFIRQ